MLLLGCRLLGKVATGGNCSYVRLNSTTPCMFPYRCQNGIYLKHAFWKELKLRFGLSWYHWGLLANLIIGLDMSEITQGLLKVLNLLLNI